MGHDTPDYTRCRNLLIICAESGDSRGRALVVLGRDHVPTYWSSAAFMGIVLLAKADSGTVRTNGRLEKRRW